MCEKVLCKGVKGIGFKLVFSFIESCSADNSGEFNYLPATEIV